MLTGTAHGNDDLPGQTTAFALSAEGGERKSAHAFLFDDFIEGRKIDLKDQGANGILNEVQIAKPNQTSTSEIVIDLPPGAERVASMFRYLILRGENLDKLEGIIWEPYSPNSHCSISTQESGVYRVKVPAMPVPSGSMKPVTIRSQCRGGAEVRVTEVAFNSQGKLSTKFDDIPYRNLGAEYPRETVEIKIDSQRELSLGGHVDLERDKFFRYYAAPGNLHASFENWAHERNFAPGRQIFKFEPALVKGYSKNDPKLTERTDRPGAADLSFFKKYNAGASLRRTIEPFRDIEYAMCFNDYPEFMSVKSVGRGTPLIEHFSDAAELAGAFVADEVADAGRSATYWEVKNESSIKSEWDYHWGTKYDAWKLLAEFHNQVADAIHEKSPATKVGGPTSAWMQMQAAKFGLYRNQTKFMDLTKGHVDFYSHHFYEDFGSLGAWERRDANYTSYLLGRLEATLDMLRAHMHETDNVKPILITECGSLQPGRGPSDYWLRMRSYSAYLHKFMQRPDQIDLSVPFIFLSIPWNPQSGDAAFIPKSGQSNFASLENCEATPLANWFDLWSDFNGRRIPVSFDRKWLDVTAVHQGDQIQLAITNMGGRRLSLDLSGWDTDLPIGSVSQKRMYYRDGQVHFDANVVHENASAVPVDVEETTIITLGLSNKVDVNETVLRETWYAGGTAVDLKDTSGKTFEISVSGNQHLQNAWLMVGVHREGGLSGPLAGTFNGKPFTAQAKWAREQNHLFAPVKIKIPAEMVAEANEITIESQVGMTITSVHLVTDKVTSR